MEFNNRPVDSIYYVSTDRELFWPIWLIEYQNENIDMVSFSINVGDTYIYHKESKSVTKVNLTKAE